MSEYNVDSIKILSDIEHVRLRPGMYIGECNHPGHLFSEIYDNALDELQNGYGTLVKVYVNTKENTYKIIDNGRGIPIGFKTLPDGTEKSVIEVLFTMTNSGGKYDNEGYKLRAGLNGVGSTVVNALSEMTEVSSCRDGAIENFKFSRGNTISHSVIPWDTCDIDHGTEVTFKPDAEIFETDRIPKSFIINRCKIASALGLKTELYFDDEAVDITSDIFDLIPVDEDSSVYTRTNFKVNDESTGESFVVAMLYASDDTCWYGGYTNLIPNINGGTHFNVMSDAVRDALNSYKIEGVLDKDYFLGLKVIVAAFIMDPSFSSQTKEKLTVDKKKLNKFTPMIANKIREWLDSNPEIRDGIFERMRQHRSQLNKFLSKKDISKLIVLNDNSSSSIKRKSVVSKLIECTKSDRSDTELLLVEGDSAAGSFLPVRNRMTQAILPLRGKILNVSKLEDIVSALRNSEILDIVNSIGAGLLDDCDPSRSRYEKIIVACLTGDTKIKCLDGNSYSFKELVDSGKKDLWVYASLPDGTVIPAKAINPRITKIAKSLAYVTLDNGEVIKCTPDHKFMLRDGTYKEAKDLTEGQSLMPGYFSKTSSGYIKIWDNSLGDYKKVHTMVNTIINSDKKLSIAIPKEYRGRYRILVTHHKDFNKLNNTPDNLEWMLWSDHRDLHNSHWDETLGKWVISAESRKLASKNITKYNKSEKHKQDASKVGSITGHKNMTEYNKSDLHRSRISELHSLGVYDKSRSEGLTNWNRSEYHKNKVREMNSDPNIILLQKRAKIAKLINELLVEGKEFSEFNYSSKVTSGRIKYNKILNYFSSYDEALEYAKNYNHKVISVQIVESNEEVYDITVPEYHNFLLDSGVFVHNCDSDEDGKHISALIVGLMVNLLPNLVKAGMLYMVEPALYSWRDKQGLHFTNELLDIPKGCDVQRFKGLGEMDPEEVDICLTNPATRHLYRIEYPDDLAQMNAALTSSSARRKLLEDLGVIKYE